MFQPTHDNPWERLRPRVPTVFGTHHVPNDRRSRPSGWTSRRLEHEEVPSADSPRAGAVPEPPRSLSLPEPLCYPPRPSVGPSAHADGTSTSTKRGEPSAETCESIR